MTDEDHAQTAIADAPVDAPAPFTDTAEVELRHRMTQLEHDVAKASRLDLLIAITLVVLSVVQLLAARRARS